MQPDFLRRLPVYLLVILVLGGAAIRLRGFDTGINRTPDERTYTRQANVVLSQGVDGFRQLGNELAENLPAVSRYPSPLRFGYITMVMLAMRLTGDTSPTTGAGLSLLCSVVALTLIAVCAYRFLSQTAALVATLFYAVLPFDLTTSRRTWEEAMISMLTLFMLLLSCALVRSAGRQRTVLFGAFAVVGFFAMSTKENASLTYLLCGLGLTAYFLLHRERRAAVFVISSVAVAVVAYVAALAWLFGGVSRSLALVAGYAKYSGINPYSVQYDSGPVWLFPEGMFQVSPFVFVAAIAGLGVAVIPAVRTRSPRSAGLPLGAALLLAAFLIIQLGAGRYSFRYTAPMFGPLCLLAGIGAAACIAPVQRRLAPLGRLATALIIGFAISVAAYRDLNFAEEAMIQPQMPDLALRPILGLPPAPVPPDYPR